MPDSRPIIRSMNWKIAKEQMPDSVSCHLPDGDPSQNHKEIKREIDRMIPIGPDGRSVTKQYVDGGIDESELENRLNEVYQDVDSQELETFRQNLRIIRSETHLPVWKEMIPLMYKVDMHKIRKAAKKLSNIQSENHCKEEESKSTARN